MHNLTPWVFVVILGAIITYALSYDLAAVVVKEMGL